MGLGAYPLVTLAEAREEAYKARKQLDNGIDPLEHREEIKRQTELAKAKAVTFDYCANLWLEKKRKTCCSAYVNDLERRLRKHAPQLFPLPAKEIDTTLVLQVLEPIWTTFPVTADHWVRFSIEEILDLAKHRGYRDRDSENPARWHPLRCTTVWKSPIAGKTAREQKAAGPRSSGGSSPFREETAKESSANPNGLWPPPAPRLPVKFLYLGQ